MSPAQRVIRLTTALSLLAVVGLLAACASPGQTPSTEGTAPGEGKAAQAPTIKLVQPVAGAAVPAGDVRVAVETTGLKFVMPSNTLVAGEGHVHFTLDDEPFVMSTEPSTVLKDVRPGRHTLVAELVQNNTESFDPPIEQEIEFVVE